MTIKELIELLDKQPNHDIDVIIDIDDDGWYTLEEVELVRDEEGVPMLNLVSSNSL